MLEAAAYSAFETLRDGRRVEIRALRPDDRAGLIAAVGRSSGQSLYRRRAGLKELIAEVLPDNIPMLKVFEKSGFGLSTKREPGVVHVALRLY